MELIESILNYKQYLKRRNLSAHTVKNYLHRLKKFMAWISVPVESVISSDVKCYIDLLLDKRLSPETINGHIIAVRRFYSYLEDEEGLQMSNPVIRGLALRLPKPLPQHIRDSDAIIFFRSVKKVRDMAMFMLMLRCGLRVEEVANLTLWAVDYTRSQIMIKCGKGSKDRVVYISNDAAEALAA